MCADRNVLLETLPTDLPFELTISRIEDEVYWERAAKDRQDESLIDSRLREILLHNSILSNAIMNFTH